MIYYSLDVKKRVQTLIIYLFLIIILGTSRIEAQKKRPNILVILTDQQSATDLGAAGNRWVVTPNMDALTERGVRFPITYAANPVCVPSKFTMQTGLYASEIGVRYNEEEPDTAKNNSIIRKALGFTFRNAGYETVFGGKVHLPGYTFGPITDFGYSQLGTDGSVFKHGSVEEDIKLNLKLWNQPSLLADAGARFLMNHKNDSEPFLLFLSFEGPYHDICYFTIKSMEPNSALAKSTPHSLLDIESAMHSIEKSEGENKFFSNPSTNSPGFDPKDYAPPLPENFEPTQGEPQAIRNLIALRPFRAKARQTWGEKGWREHRWMYAALTDTGDSYLSKVFEALRKSGLDKNTIVVLLSDHGENNGSHRLDHKTVFYNESSRVPFVFAGDGISSGVVDSTMASLSDFYPTLCDLAGIKIPKGLPGISLKPYLYGQKPKVKRKYIFAENQIGFMVTDGRYKYSWYDDKTNDEMFLDLKNDPGEEQNLMCEIWKHEYKNRAKYIELRAALLDHIKQLNKNGAHIKVSRLEELIKKGI